jgi:hypothetical protein
VILQTCSSEEQPGDVAHRLLGLTGGVADGDALGRVEVLADVAQIVVEPLLGVGVARVEPAQTLMRHG